MHVLVTGGAGFVGSHIVDKLLIQGHNVTVWDNFSTGEWGNLCDASPIREARFDVEEMTIAQGNIRSALEPDAVIHCAAVADISGNWEDDRSRWNLYDVNIKGTINMLEWCATLPDLKAFSFISTGAVYGGGDARLRSKLTSDSPYAASKIAGEALLAAYAARFRWESQIFRLASCVGSRYHHGHVADFVRMWQQDGKLHLRDNGQQRKSYVHVLDAAQAISNSTIAAADMHDPSAVGSVKTFDVTSHEWWSVLDTIRVMGLDPNVDAVIPSNESGWLGDPVNLRMHSSFSTKYRTIELGVADALLSLGWDPKKVEVA